MHRQYAGWDGWMGIEPVTKGWQSSMLPQRPINDTKKLWCMYVTYIKPCHFIHVILQQSGHEAGCPEDYL